MEAALPSIPSGRETESSSKKTLTMRTHSASFLGDGSSAATPDDFANANDDDFANAPDDKANLKNAISLSNDSSSSVPISRWPSSFNTT